MVAIGMAKTLAEIALGASAAVRSIEGSRAFRRRLLEMGLVPGTVVRLVTVAPLGDPLRIEVRSGQWSIRRAEANQIEVDPPVGSGVKPTIDAAVPSAR